METEDFQASELSSMYEEIRNDAYNFGIGRTPIYQYTEGNSNIYCKLEYRNRFKSIKDRAAFFMISRGVKSGALTEDKTIIEASSGNTGIALASISKQLGYRAKIYIPGASSEATKRVLYETGQDIVEVHDEASKRGSINIDSAVSLLKQEMEQHPGTYVNFDQYANEANTNAHFYTTGPEAVCSIPERITHVVAAIGTGGTITGLGKYFRSIDPSIRIVAAMAQPYHKIQGLKNLKVSKVPKILESNMDLIDEWVDVTDQEAESELRYLADLGLFVGLSSAANFHCARVIARKNPESRILTVFPDSGEKYKFEYQKRGLFSEVEFRHLTSLLNKEPPGCITDPIKD